MKHILPLYSFFSSLQKHTDFSLGIEEYKALIEVLAQDPKGEYFQYPEKMLSLCRLLWYKPNQNYTLFKKLFEQSFEYLKEELAREQRQENENQEIKTNSEQENNQNKEVKGNQSQNQSQNSEQPKPEEKTNDALIPTEHISDQPLFLNFEEGQGDESLRGNQQERKFDFVKNYVPFRQRELVQTWRFLKKQVNQKAYSSQIEVNTTVKRFAQEGFISKPIYQKKKKNDTNLLILIDHKGSMIAFKHLAFSLADAAIQGAGIQSKMCFFRNVPQPYLAGEEKDLLYVYENQAETKHISLKKLLESQPNTAVLIISDTGTASGSFNMNRIEATEIFLRELYSYTLKVAWLNPMPQDRWDGSSAYLIREMVDMFEANAEGLKKAIHILQGKKKPNSLILFPNFY